ncbi:MAG TPA: hypothetical protein VNK04_24365 [Gemmataceae bacterium]|nr:hypothetical protein [Gemmataceae bacterium]
MFRQSPGVSRQQYRQLIAFMNAACRVIPEHYPANACIACTRITLAALARWGFTARPCSVEVLVANPPLIARARRIGRAPWTAEELAQWSREDGSWLVHVGGGHPPSTDYWPGHLVALIEGHVLVDLALPQASMPEHQIRLTPLLCDVPAGFAQGLVNHILDLNGSQVEYRAFPDKISYQTTPDWSAPDRHADVVETIVRLMQDQLGVGALPAAAAG